MLIGKLILQFYKGYVLDRFLSKDMGVVHFKGIAKAMFTTSPCFEIISR